MHSELRIGSEFLCVQLQGTIRSDTALRTGRNCVPILQGRSCRVEFLVTCLLCKGFKEESTMVVFLLLSCLCFAFAQASPFGPIDHMQRPFVGGGNDLILVSQRTYFKTFSSSPLSALQLAFRTRMQWSRQVYGIVLLMR